MDFRSALDQLLAPLDAEKHAVEIGKLRACRTINDLDRVATTVGGWLNPSPTEPRLKLVRHGTGTFIVVEYKDGWSSRLSMQDFRR